MFSKSTFEQNHPLVFKIIKMSTKKIILFGAIWLSIFNFCNGQEMFQKLFGTSNNGETGYSILQKQTGNYIVGGIEVPASGNGNFFIAELDPLGSVVWQKKYGAQGTPNYCKLKKTERGEYLLIVSSYTTISGILNYNQFIFKTDSIGNLVWSKSYSNLFLNNFSINKTNNELFLIGRETNSSLPSSIVLINLDSLGNNIWVKKFSSSYKNIFAKDILHLMDGSLTLNASISDTAVSIYRITQPLVIKLDSIGNIIYSNQYETAYSNYPGEMALLNSGNIIMAVESSMWSFESYYGYPTIIELSSNGDINRTNTNNSFISSGLNLLSTRKGEIVLSGRGMNMTTNMDPIDCFILKMDSLGNQKICKVYSYNTLSGNGASEWGHSIYETNDNGFIVSGMLDETYTYNYSKDVLLIKTDSLLNSGCHQQPIAITDSSLPFLKTPIVLGSNSISLLPTSINISLISASNYVTNTICGTVGIEDLLHQEIRPTIYPNPATNDLTITYKPETKNAVVEIYNSVGQQVKQIALVEENQQITIADLTNGLYIMKLNDGKNSATQRFVKQ